MPRNRFTNAQIAIALRRAENGAAVDVVNRKMGAGLYRDMGGGWILQAASRPPV